MTTPSPSAAIGRRHYAGIFLLCLGTLLLELSLTRVMSVALWYHFGFLVISTALLGFGASGVTLALWRRLREDIPLDNALAVLSLLFGVLAYVLLKGFSDDKLAVTTGNGARPVDTATISDLIFKPYLLPFWGLSFVLLAAVIGAIVLARKD